MSKQGRLGDRALCSSDAHGCPACPHVAVGPAVTGSSNVKVNGMPALRVGDNGIHAACCASNTWTAIAGSATVLINGRPAHRVNDRVHHCGGFGTLVQGSENVWVGNAVPMTSLSAEPPARLVVRVQTKKGTPVKNAVIRLKGPSSHRAKTDSLGEATFHDLARGTYRILSKKRRLQTEKAEIQIQGGVAFQQILAQRSGIVITVVKKTKQGGEARFPGAEITLVEGGSPSSPSREVQRRSKILA